MLRRLAHRLVHMRAAWVVGGVVFWALNLVGWLTMMVVVQFTPSLQHSILYTIQISHWALLLTAGVGVTAAIGLLVGKHRLQSVQRDERELLTRIRDWDRGEPRPDVWVAEIDRVLGAGSSA